MSAFPYRVLAFVCLVGTAAMVAAQSNISLELHYDENQVGGGPIVAGDFNNDGKPDLVQSCENCGLPLVFKAGNGDGTFRTPTVAFSTPVAVGSMTAADVDGDGKLDLVAAAQLNPPQPPGCCSYYLTIWRGNGDGTFQAPQTFPSSMFCCGASVAVGNFFGHGYADVAIAGNNLIEIYRNDGHGKFAFDHSINMGANVSLFDLAAGDLNGNGFSDLAVVASSSLNPQPNEVYVLWNDGRGNFTQQQLGTYNFATLTIARLNGDAMMDILVSWVSQDNKHNGFDAYYGQGNNKLYHRTLVTTTMNVTANMYGLFGVDINGDGYGDIVAFANNVSCGTCSDSGMYVWLGKPDGSFQQTPQAFVVNTNGGQPGPVAMADFNRDGMMDFAETYPGDSNVPTEYYINATVRTNCGMYTISPTVTVCQPVDRTYSPSPVRIQAKTYDTTPVTDLQEYIDGKLVYSQPVTSFDQTFAAGVGTHFFVTKAWDSGGRDFVADRTVTVYNGTPGRVCPAQPDSASICLPSSQTVSSPVFILANGNTAVSTPTAAQLYIDGVLVVNKQSLCYGGTSCTAADSYVQTTQKLSPGSHDLVFKIWDLAGNVYQARKRITVK